MSAFTSCNWLPFTVSVLSAAMRPGATLVICLLPASIPFLVILGPFLMVTPLPSITVSPAVNLFAVTVFTLRSLFSLTLTPLGLATVVILSSPVISTSSPNFFTSDLLLSPTKVKPFELIAVLASAPFWISFLVF